MSSIITYDTQKAFLIPDDKREQFFNLMDLIAKYCPNATRGSSINDACYVGLDPIVIFNLDFFSEKNYNAIMNKLNEMGATDITETLI